MRAHLRSKRNASAQEVRTIQPIPFWDERLVAPGLERAGAIGGPDSTERASVAFRETA